MMVKNAGEDKIDKTTEKPDKGRKNFYKAITATQIQYNRKLKIK